MALDEGLPAPRLDRTAQRVVLGRPVSVWQMNLVALLAVLFVAFVGFSFSGPFFPLLVRHCGVTELNRGIVPGCRGKAIIRNPWVRDPTNPLSLKGFIARATRGQQCGGARSIWAESPRKIGYARPCRRPSHAVCFLVRVAARVSLRSVHRGPLAFCRKHGAHARAASRRASVA